MKKSVAKIISLALVLVCMLSLVACGGSSAAGTYKLQSVEITGMSINLEDLASAMGESIDDLKLNLELKSNGKFSFDLSDLNPTDPTMVMEGTWEASGKNITLTDENGDSIEATLDGDTLVLSEEMDGFTASMTFKKK